MDLAAIDWGLLHQQKQSLFAAYELLRQTQPDIAKHLDGLLSLIDTIQDEADRIGYPAYAHEKGKANASR